MKLKQAAITITASSGNPPGESAGIRIDIHDRISTVQIMEIKMTPEQFVSALSRLGFVPCEVEIYNTDIVNKKMETKSFEFKLDKEYSYKEQHDGARKAVKKVCPKGWKPDLSFSSQGSFFSKDNKPWARTVIRRWVKGG